MSSETCIRRLSSSFKYTGCVPLLHFELSHMLLLTYRMYFYRIALNIANQHAKH